MAQQTRIAQHRPPVTAAPWGWSGGQGRGAKVIAIMSAGSLQIALGGGCTLCPASCWRPLVGMGQVRTGSEAVIYLPRCSVGSTVNGAVVRAPGEVVSGYSKGFWLCTVVILGGQKISVRSRGGYTVFGWYLSSCGVVIGVVCLTYLLGTGGAMYLWGCIDAMRKYPSQCLVPRLL